MRSSALQLGMLLWLASAGAQAQWTASPVTGTPFDVEVPDAGTVAVATGSGSFFLQKQGSSFLLSAGPAGGAKASAYLNAQGCYCSTNTANGQLDCGAPCSTSGPLLPPATDDLTYRSRHTIAGSRYVTLQRDAISDVFAYAPAPDVQVSELVEPFCGTMSTAVSALRTAAGDYGVVAFQAEACGLLVARDGIPQTEEFVTDTNLHLGPVNELALYEAGDGGLALLVGHNTGLSSFQLLDGGAQVSAGAAVGGIPALPVVGVAFATGTGDAYGDGFGMVVVKGATEDTIWGPIPDPAHPAQFWVERTPTQTTTLGRLSRVTCLDGKLCGFIGDGTGTNQVLIYENLGAPELFVPDAGLAEGAVSVMLRTDAGDPEGDPVFVQWFPGDGGVPFTVNALNDDGTSAQVQLSGPQAVCGVPFVNLALRASISDGVHTSFEDTAVTVFNTVPPGPPVLGGPERVQAGEGAVPLTATLAAGECPALGGFTWSQVSSIPGDSFAQTPSGVTADYTPPVFLCQPEASVRFAVTVNEGHLDSVAEILEVIVEGWGAPHPAFPPGATVQQEAGTTVLYAADGGHPCDGTLGLPPPTTTWTLGASTVAGATLVHQGAPITGPVVAPQIGLQVPECTSGQVELIGIQQGTDTAGLAAAPATLAVEVSTELIPVQDANVVLTADYAAEAFVVSGSVQSDLNCVAQRATEAEVTVLREGVVISGPERVAVPGEYQLPVEIGCSGGALEVSAQLVETDGGVSDIQTQPFTAPQLLAAIGEIDGGVLPVACGQGGQGTLSTRFLPGQCPLSEVSWSQLSGPALETSQQMGTSVALQTVSRGLDGLIGETVVLAVDADAGLGNVASGTHSVVLVPAAPFVTLRQSSQTPLAEEGGLVGLAVEVINDTADCPVSGVTLTQALNGARYQEGSARLDGVPVEASVVDDALVLNDVTLEPGAPRVLTYSVRPRLLGTVAPQGLALVKGHAISPPAGLELPEGGGCGCGSVPGTLMGAAALLLALARRGRRRRFNTGG